MGLIRAEIELISVDDLVLHRRGYLPEDKIKRTKVQALVDSGAYMLAVNDQIKTQLDLPVIDNQIAELADGSKVNLEIVGPIEVRFENRRTSVDAMVLPGDAEVLLGSIPMEDMDVLIDPKRQQLIVNPENPYFAKKPLK
ncbi:MAG: aspartyl protease family protein [Acidobacteria bacterium]|nr:aspartyl protease family protein [Acidobacteriota bacterium]MBI3426940.1 aspartyl protease family protein [Acidobacteriota bacterium]